MNLAWLVAVLRPQDIAPLTILPNAEFDTQGPGRLAAIVTGAHTHLRQRAEVLGASIDWDSDRGLLNAERCLRAGSTKQGVRGLLEEISGAPQDPARACALGLIACCAAAELDDFATIKTVADTLLARLSTSNSSGQQLLRAAMLQQLSLRLHDFGLPQPDLSIEAARLLDSLDIHECPVFEVHTETAVDSYRSLAHIVAALREAVQSLVPPFPLTARNLETATRPTLYRGTQDYPRDVDMERVNVYRRYMDGAYKRALRSRTRSLVPSLPPDLFAAVLPLELLGHGSAVEARKDLAMMRFVQAANDDDVDLSDVLRLLRHSACSLT
jgi:hypothetical protein